MTDYKHTLNLPATDFPMKANLPQTEPARLQHWQATGLYEKIRLTFKDCPKFIVHDGPPYANGKIHTGHALNKILKDIVIKSKTLSGFNAPYVPGWDCHGLPIELNVEKKIGRPGSKLSAAEFRVACRQYAAQQVEVQRTAFMRLGVLGDWQHPYLTMDFKYEAQQVRAIAKILAAGHLQQGHKPVHWCTDCRSSLALAEVEYQEKQSPSTYVKFPLKMWTPESGLPDDAVPTFFLIWTTTPWTLPANQAIALNAEMNYVLVAAGVDSQKERYIIAADRLSEVASALSVTFTAPIMSHKGRQFQKCTAQHPFYDREAPVVLSTHVTAETGTGIVHIAPSHGEEDFRVGQENHLSLDTILGDDGCYLEDVPFFAGLHVAKANAAVVEKLKEHQALRHHTQLQHSYPHCWRHKTPLIFRATPQWFISMTSHGLRAHALDAVTTVTWVPEGGLKRITAMIENSPDWCISRQRTWGVPLPLFLHYQTHALHPRTLELLEHIAERIERVGVQAWFDLDPQELLGEEAEQYQKSQDTLDVWLDSGVSHFCVLRQHPELQFPADVYLEGSDQHRGWFQSSLLSSLAISNETPYKTVVTHGFLVDEKGYKMSKSLGNVIEPEEVIQSLGADILRLWTASTDYHGELAFSTEILKRTTDVYRRLRNTARYLLSNLHDFDPAQDLLPYADWVALDQWILDAAYTTQQSIQAGYAQYEFHQVYQTLHRFCSLDLGSVYLDITKDRQYTLPTNSRARRSAQSAMFHVLHALTRWMAPILSFTAEEIWSYMPGEKVTSIFLTTWHTSLQPLPENTLLNTVFWHDVFQVRAEVNKEIERLRGAHLLGSALEASVILYADTGLYTTLSRLGKELRFILITSEAQVLPWAQRSATAMATALPQLSLAISAVPHKKCVRCWHRCADLGEQLEHPELCARCCVNISGAEEERYYA